MGNLQVEIASPEEPPLVTLCLDKLWKMIGAVEDLLDELGNGHCEPATVQAVKDGIKTVDEDIEGRTTDL